MRTSRKSLFVVVVLISLMAFVVFSTLIAWQNPYAPRVFLISILFLFALGVIFSVKFLLEFDAALYTRENEHVYSSFCLLAPIEDNTIIYNLPIAIALSKMEGVYSEHHIINIEEPSIFQVEKRFVPEISVAYNPAEKKLSISSIRPLKFFFHIRNYNRSTSYCYNPTNK